MTTLDLQAIILEYIETNRPTNTAALSKIERKLMNEIINIVQSYSDEHFDGESI